VALYDNPEMLHIANASAAGRGLWGNGPRCGPALGRQLVAAPCLADLLLARNPVSGDTVYGCTYWADASSRNDSVSEAGNADLGSQFERLLVEARQGSSSSLGRALNLCRQYLLLVANRELDEELKAKGGASDLVQDTFLEAQRDFPHFTGRTQEEMLAWLRRILLNNLANFIRQFRETEKRNIAVEVPLSDDSSSGNGQPQLASRQQTPSQWAVKREQVAALEQALLRLPNEYREVIVLRNQRHLSFEAIGATMGRTAEAARKLWARAVEHLQQEMTSHDDSSLG
jgi:RNA polymerase sigma-70 factor (ECF subfamily)